MSRFTNIFNFCAKNVISWDATTGYKITGSCETTCTIVSASLTGDASTTGTTCSSDVYGNAYTAAQMDAISSYNCWDPSGSSGNGQSVAVTSGSYCCVVKSFLTLIFKYNKMQYPKTLQIVVTKHKTFSKSCLLYFFSSARKSN